MAGLWNIYRSDGQQLGPYSAGEVREALRDGSIDPFDQVARVGSKLKQTLVEVDEIFLDADQEAPKVDSVYGQAEGAGNRGHNLSSTAKSLPMQSNLRGRGSSTEVSPNQPRGRERGSSRKGRAGKPADRKANQAKKYAKRFYLLDKRNRLLGPLSAAEIQSLFYRGIIDQDVLVSKDKGEKRVPVQQFIAAYVGAKAKKFKSEQTRLHLDPGGHYAYPSVRVMDQLTRSAAAMRFRQSSKKIPWLSILLLVLALALAAIVVKKVFFEETGPVRRGSTEREHPQSIRITGPERTAPRTAIKPQATPVRRVATPKPTPRPKPRVRPKPKPKPKPRRVNNNRSGRLSRPSRPRPTPRPVIRRTTPSRPAPVRPTPARSRAAPSDPYANRVGSVVTVGSARYSVGSVSSCGGMKCTVSVRDRSGIRFSVVFFRARYQDQLKRAGGRATITGRLSKKGSSYVIYLSGVR